MQLAQTDGLKITDQLAAAKNTKRIDEASQQFEAVFLTEMMKPMFEGLSTDGMFGGGKGEEIFRSLLLQEYGKKVAQTGGIGLSTQIKAELLRQQAALSQTDNSVSASLKR
ncbi:MAG: rod-binding protein [Rhodospirillales bacterium]|nr:rod-binding protein [Alphaproteobacteria bacterium]MCB1841054.1 rod-binding protein [Alphaproteobacteria bacterium]MCB9976209.1 rod-binding protein [Rhodospirillales bacterium]